MPKEETKIQARLKELKEKERAELSAIKAKRREQREKLKKQLHEKEAIQRRQERKEDTRKKILLGAVLQSWMEREPSMAKEVQSRLKNSLTRPRDRELFGI